MAKNPLDKAADAIKDTVDNARDRVHEEEHRTNADAERAKRDMTGDEVTTGEKAASVAREAKERTQAEIDAAKRKARQ